MSMEYRWNEYRQGKTCPSGSSSTTNLTWTGLGLNPGLRCEVPATNRPSHRRLRFKAQTLRHRHHQIQTLGKILNQFPLVDFVCPKRSVLILFVNFFFLCYLYPISWCSSPFLQPNCSYGVFHSLAHGQIFSLSFCALKHMSCFSFTLSTQRVLLKSYSRTEL